MDCHGDHALACPCGGDRIKRHNRLRTALAASAIAAGLSPEVEKAGLLLARPTELGFCEAGAAVAVQGRWPTDVFVFVARWGLRGPAPFDLAVTSGLRGGSLAASAADGSVPVPFTRSANALASAALCKESVPKQNRRLAVNSLKQALFLRFCFFLDGRLSN